MTIERTWDVQFTTTVTIKLPANVDPKTDAGAELVRDALAATMPDVIEWGSYDLNVQEYVGE